MNLKLYKQLSAMRSGGFGRFPYPGGREDCGKRASNRGDHNVI